MNYKEMAVNKVEYSELEYFIRSVYGFEDPRGSFSVVAMEEWRNDSYHLFPIKKEPLDKWEKRDLTEWKTDPFGSHHKLWIILQDMVNNGHLEEGNLLIRVSW